MKSRTGSSFLIGLLSGVFLVAVFISGAVSERIWGLPFLRNLGLGTENVGEVINQRVLNEENVVTDVAEKVSEGVVTVTFKKETPVLEQYFLDPFGMFRGSRPTGQVESEQVDIGSGFVIDAAGLVVTNKHVVSTGTASDYKVVLKDESEHQVEKIWRDPANDLAILKIEGSGFKKIEMGDSDKLKVGNFVIAIGTALGEFRHTVTTGVVSGLGRGITAGDGYSFAEKLDNVIQTDAAINPGNSGGPLLNSLGQVIGVNVAVSQGANNIGFALPINLVKESMKNFNETGAFDRPFFGVRYQMISKEQGILNNVPAGGYVVEVVKGSSADGAGIKKGDIIVSLDGKKLVDVENGLVELLGKKKIGDKVEVEVWRDEKTEKMSVELKGE
ncbi:MAG: trypsin-like serine protease [Candidatus Moraniibacteriota bacterium]|nr:MAG: trypsin-like serine protease [Candidatus Moranbacteria bacterium]